MENDIDSFEIYLDTVDASSVVTLVSYLAETTEIQIQVEDKEYLLLEGSCNRLKSK